MLKQRLFVQPSVVLFDNSSYLCNRNSKHNMTFDKILDNNTLWAVRYDGARTYSQRTEQDGAGS